jgi:HPt (histidine-containing phosphotransfer) domain-containing protein
MNDYVGKPFTSQELWRCLLKYLVPVSFAILGENETVEDDSELQKQLKIEFAKSNQTKFNEIIEAVDNGDIIFAYRLAHTLKSNAGLIGKTALQKAAADVEAALKSGEKKTTETEIYTLQTELQTVLYELSPYLNEIADESAVSQSETKAPVISAEKAQALIEKLEPLLNSGNLECLKYIDELRLIPGTGELIQQMEDFYFSAAAKILDELKDTIL